MTYRLATPADSALLAGFNQQLILDEVSRNSLTIAELEERMRSWLADEYTAVVFESEDRPIGYALYREEPQEVYLRQFFVVRDRRRKGVGRRALELLRSQCWPSEKRLTVEVLVENLAALAFWRSVGYRHYSLRLEMPAPNTS